MFKRIECAELPFPLMLATAEGETSLDSLSNGFYYVISKTGMFTVCKNDLYTEVRKAESLGGKLSEIAPAVNLSVPKLDRATFDFMVKLFQAVYKKFQSEVNVLLYYSKDENKWYIRLPKQDVSGAHVTYELTEDDVWYVDGEIASEAPTNVACFGTCHSHASMGAFFSGTDDQDDKTNVGYQIVIGKVNSTAVETKCRLSMNGKNIDKKLEEVVEDLPATFQDFEVPEIVTKKATVSPVAGTTGTYGYTRYSSCEGYGVSEFQWPYTNKTGGAHTSSQTESKTSKKDVKMTSSEMEITFVTADGKEINVKCPTTTLVLDTKKG